MTKIFYAALFLICSSTAYSQITITEADMPAAGDTIRVSSGPSLMLPFEATGTDTTWDFSMLLIWGQKLIEFEDINDLPFTYQAAFNSPLDPEHKAAYATISSDSLNIPNLNVTNLREFYRKTSSEFGVIGYGAEVSGFHMPGKYDSLDLHYNFPLNYGDTSESHSIAAQQIPTIGYLHREITRTNVVDGWGTIITPYGTFDVLRVKSEIIQKDSIKFDSLPAYPALYSYLTEYKWMAKDKGLPVLKVEINNGYAQSVEFLDSIRSFASIAEAEQHSVAVYPNPAAGDVKIEWSSEVEKLEIYNTLGEVVFAEDVSGRKNYVIPGRSLVSAGVYIIVLEGEGIHMRRKLIKR